MRFRALLFTTFVASTLAFACGEDDPKPLVGDPSDSPATIGGGSAVVPTADGGTGTDAGTCAAVTLGTSQVAQNAQNDTLPAGTGGTIPNGIFDLVTDDKYIGLSGLAGPTGIGITSTISITGAAYERVETQLSASNVTSSTAVSGTFTVSGVNGVFALTCPLGTTESFTYTVSTDSREVTFYDTGANEGRTYRLR